MIGLGKLLFSGDRRTHRQEIGGAWGTYKKKECGLASGLVAGTQVATTSGWRPVDAIAVGDVVLTFDHGMQPVRSITRGQLWQSDEFCPKSLWPLHVPAEALGNLEDMIALPEQMALVESDTADQLFDDPFAMLSVADLVGYRGIERIAPRGDIEVIQMHFDEDEVVFAAAGALVHCTAKKVWTVSDLVSDNKPQMQYACIQGSAAELMLKCLISEDKCASASKSRPVAA